MENQMSDNQRRLFCRLLFLFFCCLPTAIIVYRAWHPRTPEYWQQQIFATLGVHTRLHSVETLSPQETVLRDVTVLDGYGYPVLSAMEVDLKLAPGRNQIVVRDQIRLSNQGLKYLTETVNRRLMRSGGCSVMLNDVVLTTTESGQTRELRVSPIEIISTPTNDGAHATVTMRINHAGADRDQHSTIHCNFDHFVATDQIRIHVETNRLAMPCWLANQWLPELRELGLEAGFAGRFFIEPKEQRLHGWVDGQFTDVDLAAYQQQTTNRSVGRLLGQIELRTSFPLVPQDSMAAQVREEDYAVLKLPDGTVQPIVADYEMQRVFNISSALGNTVRTARSKSATRF